MEARVAETGGRTDAGVQSFIRRAEQCGPELFEEMGSHRGISADAWHGHRAALGQ